MKKLNDHFKFIEIMELRFCENNRLQLPQELISLTRIGRPTWAVT